MKKRISILGSTGSIGTQTLEVISEHSDQFQVEILTAGSNAALLIEQAKKYHPSTVVIADKSKYKEVADVLQPMDINVWCGADSIAEVATYDVDMVVAALMGYSGVQSTIAALENGNDVALANKETLVAAGELVMESVLRNRRALLPIDSEHAAIFQCLVGEQQNEIEKLMITGSGGPFRGKTEAELEHVTVAQALNHPTWSMGRKITIDSASLMNKGLEVIEAHWLFGVPADKIEVVIHPQSIIHSMVQFVDGSIKAQLGLPSMKHPISYALHFPERAYTTAQRFDFNEMSSFTFEQPDNQLFRNLDLAYQALERGGNMPCILNAANEVAVAAFLNKELSFLAIAKAVEKSMKSVPWEKNLTLDVITETDRETRAYFKKQILSK